MVVRGEEGDREIGLGMVVEVGRDITDAQPPVGRAVVGMGPGGLRQGLGDPLVPVEVFGVDRPGIVAGAEVERVEQIALRPGIVRLQMECASEAGDRVFDLALLS
jgi:hypothetical protein